MKYKTFDEVIQGGFTYPSIIPDDLQAVIYDWYKYRQICDNDKFEVLFTRLLLRDYSTYKQLLRISPQISDYDWLVTQYHELQREATETATGTATNETRTSGETRRVNDTTETETIARGKAYSSNDDGTSTDSTRRTVDDDTVVNRKDNTTDSVESSTTTTSTVDDRSMGKDLPMSTEYAGSTAGFPGSLDWHTASTQAERKAEGKDATTGTNSRESETTGKTSTDRDMNETVTGNGETADKTIGAETETGQKLRNVEGGETANETGETTATNETEQEKEGLTREILTGRNNQIALILNNAKEFIISSNAWEWLASRIDTVFMGVYDI